MTFRNALARLRDQRTTRPPAHVLQRLETIRLETERRRQAQLLQAEVKLAEEGDAQTKAGEGEQ
jgi:hypothetical protein